MNLKNILIVDDSKFARNSIKRILEPLACHIVAEAVDGVEGIQMCEEYSPNIIISDLEMPNMDGISMIKEIRSYNNDIKIVVVTFLVNAQMLQELIKLNVAIVKKPIKETLLLRALDFENSKRRTKNGY